MNIYICLIGLKLDIVMIVLMMVVSIILLDIMFGRKFFSDGDNFVVSVIFGIIIDAVRVVAVSLVKVFFLSEVWILIVLVLGFWFMIAVRWVFMGNGLKKVVLV